MTSCTIIISHYESEVFLRACLRQLEKYAHSEIEQRIIICDQSGVETLERVREEFSGRAEIVHTEPRWSGYGIDYLMRHTNIQTEYIVQIHSDTFPISSKWLYLPITLIEEYDFSFVGQLQFISKPTDTIYPPVPFFAMAQCFNVAKTETYKEMSMQAGFTRWDNRQGMEYLSSYWENWAKIAPNSGASDDDVPAFCWEDKYKTHDKLGLAVTGYVEPQYGRIIEDIVLHWGSHREALGVMDRMPQGYQDYTERIKADYSDELIAEIIEKARANRPPELEILSRNFWDGDKKEAYKPHPDIIKRIEELKQ